MLVVALSTNVGLADAPGNVVLAAHETALPRDSVANVSQVLTIDRSTLTERARSLRPALMARVDTGLRLALGLD